MMMVMMMAMTMMTNIIPYRRTKTHIWEKVLMGIWVHPVKMMMTIRRRRRSKVVLIMKRGCSEGYQYSLSPDPRSVGPLEVPT